MQVGDKVRTPSGLGTLRTTERPWEDKYPTFKYGVEYVGRMGLFFYEENELEPVGAAALTFTDDEWTTILGGLGAVLNNKRFPNIARKARPLYNRIYEYLINTEGDEG